MPVLHRLVARDSQAPTATTPIKFRSSAKKFADETPKQQADHHEVAKKYARKRKHSPKTYRRMRELEIIFADRYGAVLPDDDAGLDDLLVMANHLAHLDEPGRRIKAWVRQWAPWHSKARTARLILAVQRKPLKWSADKLAERVGLDDATRTRLGITTIGAIDCKKAKREARRRHKDAARHKVRRAKAGAKPRAHSVTQTQPWKAEGISRRTWYRRRNLGTVGTDSSAACAKHIESGTHSCQPNVSHTVAWRQGRDTPEQVVGRLHRGGLCCGNRTHHESLQSCARVETKSKPNFH